METRTLSATKWHFRPKSIEANKCKCESGCVCIFFSPFPFVKNIKSKHFQHQSLKRINYTSIRTQTNIQKCLVNKRQKKTTKLIFPVASQCDNIASIYQQIEELCLEFFILNNGPWPHSADLKRPRDRRTEGKLYRKIIVYI